MKQKPILEKTQEMLLKSREVSVELVGIMFSWFKKLVYLLYTHTIGYMECRGSFQDSEYAYNVLMDCHICGGEKKRCCFFF